MRDESDNGLQSQILNRSATMHRLFYLTLGRQNAEVKFGEQGNEKGVGSRFDYLAVRRSRMGKNDSRSLFWPTF